MIWERWAREIRLAGRRLWRDRRFTAFAVATLALGISANAAVFAVADRLLLRGPAHVDRPHELVRVFLTVDGSAGEAPRTGPWVPFLTAEALRTEASSLAGLALFRLDEALIGGADGVERVSVGVVDASYFDLVGVRPVAGRLLGSTGTAEGPSPIVTSHRMWVERGSDPSWIGATLEVDGERREVVGVAPPGFAGHQPLAIDVWAPLDPDQAGGRNWQVVGRLPEGVDAASAQARVATELHRIHQRTDPGRFFGWAREATVEVGALATDDEGRPRAEAAIARLLLAVAGVVLLVSIANVANLIIARLRRRRRELSIRVALGIGQAGLSRHLSAETVVLALLAAVVSIPAAALAGEGARSLLLPGFAWQGPALSWPIVAVTALATLITGLGVSLVPLRRARRAARRSVLRVAAPGASRRTARLQWLLAASQVALSASLLLGAGLFLRSFLALRLTDLGVDADRVVAFTLHGDTRGPLVDETGSEWNHYTPALDVLVSDPGVERAATTLGLPFVYNFGMSVAVDGWDSIPTLPGGGPYLSGVTPDYFETTGTSITQGRSFTAAEVAGQEPVVIVSGAMAASLWPAGDALGSCLRIGSSEDPCSTVVGIAEDVHRVGYREPASMQYYVPLPRQSGFGGMAIVARLRIPTASEIDRLRDVLLQTSPGVRFVDARVLARVLDPEVRPWRLGSWVLGSAALLALLVSLIGVYGVLSYLVEQRRREMGVRIALGASPGGIRTHVVRSGMAATGLGLAAGLALLIGARGWIQPLLFETSGLDPTVIVGVTTIVVAAALTACAVPAWRASTVQPAVCLRED